MYLFKVYGTTSREMVLYIHPSLLYMASNERTSNKFSVHVIPGDIV